MMRTAFAAAAVAVLAGLAVLAPAASAGQGGLRIMEAGSARFPDRAFILTLPKKQNLRAANVHVGENGVPVSGVTVTPVGAGDRGDFGVVLVIDTTLTMHSPAIDDAMEAARAFAARRPPSQELAVITFNQNTNVLLPFTTDAAAIDAALASTPALGPWTPLYDAVNAGVSLIQRAKISAGSVIVLSDGADTGSRASLEQVGLRAQKAHVRIFPVAIRSKAFRVGPLKNLARVAGGEYYEAASTADLARIYDQLGARLAGEYLIRYRSHAGPDATIHVRVRVDGTPGVATTGYVTPALPNAAAAHPYHKSLGARIWQSAATMLFISLLSAGLFAVGVMLILRPKRGNLRARMAQFVSVRLPSEKDDEGRLTERVFLGAERSLETTKWWARFVDTLELADVRMPAVTFLLWTFVATFFTMWLLALVAGSLLFGLLGLCVPFATRGWIKRKVDRRRSQFAEQLPDNLQVLASALRAGHSLVGALSVVVDDASEPSKSELRRVVADEQLGIPLEEALNVSRRMDNRDLQQVGLVAALQRESGGNMAEVLDRVTETIRERFELRRMVKTLTAQGRMSRWVVSLLPIVLLAAISLLNPEYIAPLFNETFGRILLAMAAVMLVAGSLIIKKIVDIKL
jgi:tight adherence protein B